MHVIGGTCLEDGHVYEDTLTYEFEKNVWCTHKDDGLLEPRLCLIDYPCTIGDGQPSRSHVACCLGP